MKKYCPFCESELSDTLWCEQCKRQVILYNTYSSAADRNTDEQGTLHSVTAAGIDAEKDLAENTAAAHTYFQAVQNESVSNKPVLNGPVPNDPLPDSKEGRPKRDLPKLVFLGSLLLVCLVLCFILCAQLLGRKDAASAGTSFSARKDTPDEDNRENSKAPEQSDEDTPDRESTETAENSGADTPTEETNTESAEESEVDSADWKKLETLTPLDLQTYGGTNYYYYASEDIEALGLQCTYYHLDIAYDQAAAEITGFFGKNARENSPADDAYFNSYVDSGSEYYTSFQQILSYDCGEIQCSINYDTGSGTVHFISFSGTNIENYAELILAISGLASPDHTLSPEALQESILAAKNTLLNLDPPDMWHEENVYQDSCISLSMTYSGDTYELQLNSRKYADDTAMNTLSISRPKY